MGREKYRSPSGKSKIGRCSHFLFPSSVNICYEKCWVWEPCKKEEEENAPTAKTRNRS